jgi:hypothetical protein
MTKPALWREVLRGVFWAVLAGFAGSLLLTLLAFLHFAKLEISFPGDPTLEGFGLLLVYVLVNGLVALSAPSFVPSILGGALLVMLIRTWTTRVARPVLTGCLLGGFVGLAATAVSILLSIVFYFWFVPEDPQPFLPFIIAACIIGTTAGGLVGTRLALLHVRT